MSTIKLHYSYSQEKVFKCFVLFLKKELGDCFKIRSHSSVKEMSGLAITVLRFGQMGLSQEYVRNLGRKLKMGMKGTKREGNNRNFKKNKYLR